MMVLWLAQLPIVREVMGSNSAFFNEIPFGSNIIGVSVSTKILKWRQKCAMVGSTSSNHQSIRTKIGNCRNLTKNKIKTKQQFLTKEKFRSKNFLCNIFFLSSSQKVAERLNKVNFDSIKYRATQTEKKLSFLLFHKK